MERQDLFRTYLAHHDLESIIVIVVVVVVILLVIIIIITFIIIIIIITLFVSAYQYASSGHVIRRGCALSNKFQIVWCNVVHKTQISECLKMTQTTVEQRVTDRTHSAEESMASAVQLGGPVSGHHQAQPRCSSCSRGSKGAQ